MECFFCRNGETSRCEKVLLFGSPMLDGAQAEYVRVPLADGTLFAAPSEIPEETVVLMADIVFPPLPHSHSLFPRLTGRQKKKVPNGLLRSPQCIRLDSPAPPRRHHSCGGGLRSRGALRGRGRAGVPPQTPVCNR